LASTSVLDFGEVRVIPQFIQSNEEGGHIVRILVKIRNLVLQEPEELHSQDGHDKPLKHSEASQELVCAWECEVLLSVWND
jgi:hypothetical protein